MKKYTYDNIEPIENNTQSSDKYIITPQFSPSNKDIEIKNKYRNSIIIWPRVDAKLNIVEAILNNKEFET